MKADFVPRLGKPEHGYAEGIIHGSPWGAVTSSPTSTQIIWAG